MQFGIYLLYTICQKELIMKKITVYSLSTCPVCKRLNLFLDEKGLTYKLIEVDTLDSGEQWLASKELARHNPNGTFPTTVIEDMVIGYDPEALMAKLGSRQE